MRRVPRKRRGWKKKVLACRDGVKTMQGMAEIDDLDVSVSLIQALIPVGLDRVYLGDQKVPAQIPRVRNKILDQEVPLEAYDKLQRPYQADSQVFKKLLNGLSMRKYEESAQIVPEVFGLSASNMSKRFKVATAGRLRRLMTRDLSQLLSLLFRVIFLIYTIFCSFWRTIYIM